VWDTRTWEILLDAKVASESVFLHGVALSAGGRLVAVAGNDLNVHVFDVDRSRRIQAIPLERRARSVAFSCDGRFLAFTTDEGATVCQRTDPADPDEPFLRLVELRGHRGYVNHLTFSPDGTRLFTGGADGTVRTWPLQTVDLLDAAARRRRGAGAGD
jgi:WD40 repeat protein